MFLYQCLVPGFDSGEVYGIVKIKDGQSVIMGPRSRAAGSVETLAGFSPGPSAPLVGTWARVAIEGPGESSAQLLFAFVPIAVLPFSARILAPG